MQSKKEKEKEKEKEKDILKKVGEYIISKKPLGKGQFGEVYKGWIENNPSLEIAIKIISLSIKTQKIFDMLNKEIEIWKAVKSDNLVNLINAVQTTNNLYIIMEYCNEGDLRNYWKRKGKKIEEKEVISILIDLCKGFKCLYKNNIIHRDIKPENILLHNGKAKIGDFGFARFIFDSGMEELAEFSIKGTPKYMSLQILEGSKYSSKCDIWSVGVLAYEMLFGTIPWVHGSPPILAQNIKSKSLSFPTNTPITSDMKDLLSKMMIVDDELRIGWPDVFNHPLIHLD